MDVISNMDGVVPDPEPQIVFREMADFSLNFQAKFWINEYTNQYKKKMGSNKENIQCSEQCKNKHPIPYTYRVCQEIKDGHGK